MSAPFKNVAVIGAGGNLGTPIVRALLAGNFNVTIIARSSSQSTFPAGVTVKKGDYTLEFLTEALKGQDAIVSTVGSTGLLDQKVFIDAAIAAGVKRILPSEFGADTSNPRAVQGVPFFAAKAEVSKHLQAAVVGHPETTWTAVSSGPFFDWCFESSIMGFDVKNHKATLYDEGKAKFDTTLISTVAAAVVGILSRPDKYQNETVYINSFAVSQKEVLDATIAVTGGDWEIEQESADKWYKEGFEKIAKGDYSGFVNLIFGSIYEGSYETNFSAKHKTANEELGLPKDDLQEVVKKLVAKM